MSAFRDKIIKNSIIAHTATLSTSKIFGKKDMISTKIPMINVALSADFEGGFTPGVTLLCGHSKHFKSGFALLLASAFLDKYPDGTILFYDNEFGTPQGYFETFGIPLESVVHTPITNIEELKFDLMKQLAMFERDDKVMIVIDSIGNLASIKEVNDALEESDAADMTRAKQLKSLFRMITPYLTIKDIPLVAVNHIYMTQEKFSKAVVSGGSGPYLSADTIWIIGRNQEKEDDELSGYKFIINIEKSRYVREKSKIPINISFEHGINKWSGLFDIALEAGFFVSGKKGWYHTVNIETGELSENAFRRSAMENSSEFWEATLNHPKMIEYITKTYHVSNGDIIEEEEEPKQIEKKVKELSK